MHIKGLRLRNYKSFEDSSWIELAPGFNVIAGQNNSGKTALLEGMSLHFRYHATRNERTVPVRGAYMPHDMPPSSAEVVFATSGSELRNMLMRQGRNLFVPRPDPQRHAKLAETFDIDPGRLLTILFEKEEIQFRFKFVVDALSPEVGVVEGPSSPSIEEYQTLNAPGQRNNYVRLQVRSSNESVVLGYDSGGRDFGISFVAPYCRQRTYMFHAERSQLGSCPFLASPDLQANAGNLAKALHQLQSNPERFREFNRLVHKVLPLIQQVTVVANPPNVDIHVWTHSPATQREDLAIPLSESGTGVGQVLAMLYVVFASDDGQVILIDEPISFLHSGAFKRLIEIMREHPQHQYVLSTHSPEVMSWLERENVLMVHYTSGSSRVTRLDLSKRDDVALFLSEVGSSLSDVFGAEGVIWVEGPTEELCFPYIVKELLKVPLLGIVIRAVHSTDQVLGKRAEEILDTYGRLTTSATLVPPALAFIFDREDRSDERCRDLQKRNGLKLLERRMYENYLLCPESIAALVSEGLSGEEVGVDAVSTLLTHCLQQRRFYGRTPVPEDEQQRIRRVHGADVLSYIFSELSDRRLDYRKTVHSFELTRDIVQRSPDYLKEVTDLPADVLSNAGPPAH